MRPTSTTLWLSAVLAALLAFIRPAPAQFPPGMGLDTPPVTVRAVSSQSAVAPGDQFAVAAVLSHAPSWHTWPNKPVIPAELGDFEAIPTTVEILEASAGLQTGPIQWPEAATVPVPWLGADLLSYKGEAPVLIPIVAGDLAGATQVTLRLRVSFQACDDAQCLQPESHELSVTLPVVALTEGRAKTDDAAIFENLDRSVFADMLAGRVPVEAVEFNAFGLKFSVDPSGAAGTALLLLVAAAGGFLLNLTPCVLPVVPLKVMGLAQAAGNARGRSALLGLSLSAGMVAFFVAIGGAISLITGFDAISSLFQTGWFAIVVGLVIGVMALGMFGLFTTSLPQWVYRITPNHETLWGSFVWGILMAVLSTPCTAPFMGAAAAWAARQDAGTTLATFAAIGGGMALPYLVLAANPKWVSKVPRTGPASELVKQVIGLLLISVAAYFVGTGLSPLLTKEAAPAWAGYWWGVGAGLIAAGAWLVYRTVRITKKPVKRVIWGAIGAALVAAGLWTPINLTDDGPIDWEYYTPAIFEEARARGDVVVLDFTAEWCLNCKAMEKAVLFRPEVASILNSEGVTPVKVDLTGDNPAGRAKLRELDWVGIPLLAIYGPGVEKPIRYDAYTVDQVLDAIGRARGGR